MLFVVVVGGIRSNSNPVLLSLVSSYSDFDLSSDNNGLDKVLVGGGGGCWSPTTFGLRKFAPSPYLLMQINDREKSRMQIGIN